MEKRLLFLLVSILFCFGGAMAQTKVTGAVVSLEDGEPIIGASVVVAGANKTGTTTDIDGHFSMDVPAGKKLVVSYIGMESQTIAPAANMLIKLKAGGKSLDEVVVTGMQKVDKRLFTGAAASVNAAEAKLDGVADISRSLEDVRQVFLYRMSLVHLVLLRKFVCVVLRLSMVVQSLFG